MSQIHDLPPWAQCLHEALRELHAPLADLYEQLDLPSDGGWLGEALAGRTKPKRGQLALLSACTDIPLAVLEGTAPVGKTLAVALRAQLDDATEADVAAASHQAEQALLDLGLLLSWFPQEAARTSAAAADARRAVARSGSHWQMARQTAERLRDVMDLDDAPIADLVELVESLGAAVIQTPMPDCVQGITVHDPFNSVWRAVVLINSNTRWARQRFTLAHELCHLLFEDDGALFVTRKQVDEQDPAELRAEVFARHFLAPEGAIRRYWADKARKPDADYAKVLGNFMLDFGISRQATIIAFTEVLSLGRDVLAAYDAPDCSVPSIMQAAGREDEWNAACSTEHESSASPWMRSMALDAFRSGVVDVALVARVLGRPDDLDAVEQELRDAGWTPEPESERQWERVTLRTDIPFGKAP